MDSFQFPAWYQSSAGPGLSKTIVNMVLGLLPVINLFMQTQGQTILPAEVNSWVSLAVFGYFAVQAAVGYIRSKAVAQDKMVAIANNANAVGSVSAADFNRITRV